MRNGKYGKYVMIWVTADENGISEDNFQKFAKFGTYHKEFVALFYHFLSSGKTLTIHLG